MTDKITRRGLLKGLVAAPLAAAIHPGDTADYTMAQKVALENKRNERRLQRHLSDEGPFAVTAVAWFDYEGRN